MQIQEHSMKAISLFTLGATLLITGVAFAQAPAAPNSDGSSNSNNSDVSQNNAPGNNTPSKATDADGNTAQSISQACDKQASDKNLSGDAKTTWVKKCKMGKTTRSGN
jgi:hypothetical protein